MTRADDQMVGDDQDQKKSPLLSGTPSSVACAQLPAPAYPPGWPACLIFLCAYLLCPSVSNIRGQTGAKSCRTARKGKGNVTKIGKWW